MKLTLNELKVDSSIVQVTEDELTAVKGGMPMIPATYWQWLEYLGITVTTIDTIQRWVSGGASGGQMEVKFSSANGDNSVFIKVNSNGLDSAYVTSNEARFYFSDK